jgi:glycosyltransferase involved in cell wall biosynthesis
MTIIDNPALSIVIPTFNEAEVLAESIALLGRYVDLMAIELVLVDDGSSDATAAIATEIVAGLPRAHLVALPVNRGKGAALRAGIAVTSGDAVLFMDADMSTSLDVIDIVIGKLMTADVVIGSRAVSGSVVERSSALRVAMGRSFNAVMRTATGLDVHDSQCGFKAFRGTVARDLFRLSTCDRFAIDPEVLCLAKVLGYSVLEYPVEWVAGRKSSVRPVRDSILTALDLAAVSWATRPAGVQRRIEQTGVDVGSPVVAPLEPGIEPLAT